jgi:hypothetical protein
MSIVTKLLRIRSEETSFAHRGFWSSSDSARVRLEQAGEFFLRGYHAALPDLGVGALAAELESIQREFRGFAYEGASMGLDILDQLMPWKAGRVQELLNGPGSPHIYMVHVGVGWSLARLRFRLERRLSRLDPLLRWLALDGFGFHEGYFHWTRYADGKSLPPRLHGYHLRAFDQGLGRSLWFVGGADAERISTLLSRFPASRRGDLWSGIGLACTYAGGANTGEIENLRDAARECSRHLAQGAVFAAKTRERARNLTPYTELACRTICGLSAAKAAEIADRMLPRGSEDSGLAYPAYEIWRRGIRLHFPETGHINEGREEGRGIKHEQGTEEYVEETENVHRPAS